MASELCGIFRLKLLANYVVFGLLGLNFKHMRVKFDLLILVDFALQGGIEGPQMKDIRISEQTTSCEGLFCKVG